MYFIDRYDNGRITLPELYQQWKELKTEDPYNHACDFKTELFEILLASINGRNDLDIIGPTPPELSRFLLALRSALPCFDVVAARTTIEKAMKGKCTK